MSITPKAIQSLIWKRQSKAGCALGMYSRNSEWSFPRWEALRFHQRPRRHSMRRRTLPSLCTSVLARSRTYHAVDAHTRYRLRQWLRYKHNRKGAGTGAYPDEYLYEQLGLVHDLIAKT